MLAPQDRQELTSWKEIANHLQVNTRTAQKWEQDRGMPVRRLPGGRGRVAAYVDELQQWKDREPTQPPPTWRRWRPWAGVAFGLGLVALMLTWAAGPSPQPAEARVDGESLVARDAKGRELWRKRFPRLVSSVYENSQARLSWVGDLDGDGNSEVLFSAFTHWDSVLICYSNAGKEKWRFVPGQTVRSAADEFRPPFITAAFEVLELPPPAPRRIVVTSHHYKDYASQVALVSATGQRMREYWHSGHLNTLMIGDLNRDGRPEIYTGGVSNGYSQATLIELDPETMDGASLETAAKFQLLGFRHGVERKRILFPRSCINRVGAQYNGLTEIRILPGELQVGVQETFGLEPQHLCASYLFGPSLALRRAGFTDLIRPKHAEARRLGQINHDFSPSESDALRNIRILR